MNTHLTLFLKSNKNEEDFIDKKKVYLINEEEESRGNHEHLEEGERVAVSVVTPSRSNSVDHNIDRKIDRQTKSIEQQDRPTATLIDGRRRHEHGTSAL
jgi:hypothetical protein